MAVCGTQLLRPIGAKLAHPELEVTIRRGGSDIVEQRGAPDHGRAEVENDGSHGSRAAREVGELSVETGARRILWERQTGQAHDALPDRVAKTRHQRRQATFRLLTIDDRRGKHGHDTERRLPERGYDQPVVVRRLPAELDPRVARAELLLHEPQKPLESGVHDGDCTSVRGKLGPIATLNELRPWVFLVALVMVGCHARNHRASEPARAAALTTTETPPAAASVGSAREPAREKPGAPFAGTVGILDVPRNTEPSMLTAVRAAAHEGYDRVVFEFRGAAPGYHVEYIDRPVRDCGAGEPRPIAGDGWLEVRFFPANAHDEQGRPTVPFGELRPNLPNVVEVERTCDFEAVVTWVLGTRSPKHYRVLELSAPTRFVVDVRH
jgi:hypothetical protein